MHRDIRSFFSVKKAKKPEDDDSDVIPESPKLAIVNKKKQSRKRRQIQEESDEEIFSPPKKNKNAPKPSLKEVKAVDIFGSAPIKRSEPIVKKSKKVTETGIHSDEEFEKSLLQIDEVDNSLCPKPPTNDNHVSKVDIIKKLKEKPVNNHDSKDNFNSFKKDKESESIKTEIYKNDRKLGKNKNEKKVDDIKSKTKTHDSKEKSTRNLNKKEKEPTSQKGKVDKIDNDQTIDDIISKSKNHDSKDNLASSSYIKRDKESTSYKRKLDKFDNCKNTVDSKPENIKKEKADFSEFLKDDETYNHEDKSSEPKQKRAKLDKSLNNSVLTDEERHERKRYSAALYQKYRNRSGPKHLGSKEIPEGLPNCLKDCAFLLTGVLDSFERDEVVAAITKYGGCVKPGISKKVTHVLAGDEAGPAKLAKAEELGIRIINEDEFLNMIKGTDKIKASSSKEIKKENKVENKTSSASQSKEKKNVNIETNKKVKHEGYTNGKKERSLSPKKVKNDEVKSEKIVNGVPNKSDSVDNSLMWVDKYKPTNLKQIIGQHGEKSNVKKLSNWLIQWYVNRKAKIPKPSPWAKDDNGAYYKAALLSGPPGVGKTTTVSLVCKELGFDMVEFNASDTRSKTLIREQIGELLSTTSLSAYARGSTGKGAVSKKHVLVMDEVDGMAGNEDRGGLQELISLIKSTSVPVICMCNDRSSEKMRSLLNYCYDLRFERPRANQIMCAMLSVCFKEGVKVPNDVLTQLIEAAGHDIRQTLHMLSVWVADSSLMDDDRLKREAGKVKKDMKMGPWEAIRRVFSAEEHQKMSIYDKSDLFFTDYSIMPLFVQENYLNVVPHGPGKASFSKLETLERLSRAADSISSGDLVDARIRRNQAWSLLPIQAMYSSVIPGQFMEGHIAGQIQFPGWLGKNSRANKMRRLAQEIHAHTRLSTSGSKSSIFLDYSTHIRDAILNPLIKDKTEGIEQSLRVLESYNLLREDLDSLVELSLWPEKRNPIVLIEPKVKAALTRTYNKTASALPYAPVAVKKGRGVEDSENSQEDYEEVEADSDPENDTMIKKKKSKEAEKAGPSKASGKAKKNVPSSPGKGKKGKTKANNKR
ncbi:replication factor C subunit 1 isoform X2 [Pararge aegeria]|uniref:replication factor C subunit 1 isoform X1 n=1 Tax=Pararge aegeria TaxID=116150 RepID=UPI0019D026D2|nr:replication factor C subunit 1 isoform X1 [Pararge aegeria]XP_039765627.1 replication factor C subunit 1 isoform X2 [Pararge aegeria]